MRSAHASPAHLPEAHVLLPSSAAAGVSSSSLWPSSDRLLRKKKQVQAHFHTFFMRYHTLRTKWPHPTLTSNPVDIDSFAGLGKIIIA